LTHSILIVEDNIETAKNILLYLDFHGFACDLVHSGSLAIEQFHCQQYDLVILDVMLPDVNGHDVCKHIRQTSDVPIIMLTAKVQDQDLSTGLEVGADDYIRKPYSNKELVARVKAHLRRYKKTETSDKLGPYSLNQAGHSISVNGKELTLTQTEYKLMTLLLKSPGQVFSREQLFLSLFEHTSESFERTIDVHLHNLRKKITQLGLQQHGIKSVYGIGYKLEI